MNLIALDFWSIVAIGCILIALGFVVRLARFIAAFTEQTIKFMVRAGMAGPARMLLAVLIGYDGYTYQKSRFLLWHQVRFRLELFWGGCLLGLVVLFLLKGTNAIDSVGAGFVGLLAVYLVIRCFIYWLAPADRINSTNASLRSSIHDVKEQTTAVPYRSHQLIRQWDYLDELFAEP